MKKIFTLAAAIILTLSAQAFSEEWKSSTTASSPVALTHITATFDGSWTFSNNYAVGSADGQSVSFTTTAAGNLTINFGGEINTGKKLHMQDGEGNGLTAKLVSDPSVTIEDNANPAANIASGDGVIYALEANKTYTFSASGTKWRLASFKYTDEAEIVYTTKWNFSEWDDEKNGFSNQVKNNLGIFACYKDAETQITNFGKINASNKGSYTKRFQFGGGGAPLEGTATPTQRFVYFNVTGNADIAVQVINGSSSATNNIVISDGTNILTNAETSSSLTEIKAKYTGDAAVIYIYGTGSLNIYDIKANNVGTTVKLDDTKKPTGIESVKTAAVKADAAAYNLAGQKVAADYKGLVIVDGKKMIRK